MKIFEVKDLFFSILTIKHVLSDYIRRRVRSSVMYKNFALEYCPQPGFTIEILAGLLNDLDEDGFCIIPGYLTSTQCELARSIIENLSNDPIVRRWYGSLDCDLRLWGVENAHSLFNSYISDYILNSIGSIYAGEELKSLLVMAGRLSAIPGNLGSGEGWHRDATSFQYKSITYLSDVDVCNGPFQVIRGSHKPIAKLYQNVRLNGILNIHHSRFPTITESDTLPGFLKANIRTLSASAGDCILVNTSTLHRGKPILSGLRYAITNYYYPLPELNFRETSFGPLRFDSSNLNY